MAADSPSLKVLPERELMTNRLENSYSANQPHVCLDGYLLVAAPSSDDKFFKKTVCLVVEHTAKGAVGIVLNRGIQSDTAGLWRHLAGDDDPQHGPVHFGGPDSGPVVAVHNCDQHAEIYSAEGVYLAAQIQNLKALVRSDEEDCDFKIIVGQADWKAGQLDREFLEGQWLPLPVSSDIVFADTSLMWKAAMKQIGDQFVADITNAKQPPHILLN